MEGNHGHPAHPPPLHRHNTPVIVLVTVATLPRASILATPEVHAALREAWGTARHWLTGYYLVMPDHVHLFCAPGVWEATSVKNWARYWKTRVVERLPSLRGRFQADCWDTQMRTQEHYLRKLEYVRENPVRYGLVSAADDWHLAGTVHALDWI